MGFTSKLFANPDFGWSNKVRLPEHRQIELYTKPRILTFDEPPLPEEAPLERIAALARAAVVFEATLAGLYPDRAPARPPGRGRKTCPRRPWSKRLRCNCTASPASSG